MAQISYGPHEAVQEIITAKPGIGSDNKVLLNTKNTSLFCLMWEK